MFRCLPLLTACLLTLVVRGAGGAPAGKTPHFTVVGSDTAEVGKIGCIEKKTVLFRIKNAGEVAGHLLNIFPTCSCTTGSADKRFLQPQEEAVVTVVLDPSTVRGVFKRSVWVETDDPAVPRLGLSLKGEILPLFLGVPERPQRIELAEGATWTNRYTFTATATNLFLGMPTLSFDTNKLAATVTVVTNSAAEPSYEVTLTVLPLALGRHHLFLSLPVEGRGPLYPIKLAFEVRVGFSPEIRIAPSKIMLSPTVQPLTRRVFIMIADVNIDTNALTWSPQREGVSVKLQADPSKANMTATLAFSSEAVTNLLKEKDPKLTFHYPKCLPASLIFGDSPAKPTGTNTTSKTP